MNLLKSRKLKHGGMATLITAIFIAAVIIINIIATMLVDMFNLKSDLTKEGIFSLSATSIDYLSNIEEQVVITVLYDEAEFEISQGEYSAQASNVIRQYAAQSRNISLQYIDPLKNPEKLSEYSEDNVSQGNIIVEAGDRKKIVSLYDLYDIQLNESTYQYEIIGSAAEQTMTSAIMFVTEQNPTTVIILSGNENGDSSYLEEALNSNLFNVVKQNLTVENINEEAKIAVLYTPTKDLSLEQIEKLDEFLDNNGNFSKNLIYVPSPSHMASDLPNLTDFLNDWGIVVTDNLVVETDTNKIISSLGGRFFIFPEFNSSSEFGSVIKSSDRPLAGLYTREVKTSFLTNQNRKTEILMDSTATSALYPIDILDTEWNESAVEKSSYTCAVVGSRGASFETEGVENSRVFTFGSAYAFNQYLTETSLLNHDLFIGILNNISNKTDIIIPSKSATDILGADLDISDAVAGILGIVFTFALPILVLAAGIIIWVRRRHL